jgi:hypothetical protein
LAGADKTVAQLRELLKDLRFRNRLERHAGELLLIEGQVESAIKFGAVRTQDQVAELFRLLVMGSTLSKALVAVTGAAPRFEAADELAELGSGATRIKPPAATDSAAQRALPRGT